MKILYRAPVSPLIIYIYIYIHTFFCQAPLSMEFSRQEYWSGLPFPFPGDLPNPGIEPGSLAWQADCLLYEPSDKNEDSSESVNCSMH